MKKLLSMMFVLLVSPTFAQPYKCVINGKTEYTDKPCPAGTGQPLVVTPPPSDVERQAAEQRAQSQKQRADELEAERKAREPQPAPASHNSSSNDLTLAPAGNPPQDTETTVPSGSTVSPEEGARQGAAGRTYRRERPEQTQNRPEVKPSPVLPFPTPTPR